jgi:hypothetical protein
VVANCGIGHLLSSLTYVSKPVSYRVYMYIFFFKYIFLNLHVLFMAFWPKAEKEIERIFFSVFFCCEMLYEREKKEREYQI